MALAAAMAGAEEAAAAAQLESLVRASDTILIGTLHSASGSAVKVTAWDWLAGPPVGHVSLQLLGEHGTSPSGRSAWNAKGTGERVLLFMKRAPDRPERIGALADHAEYVATDSTHGVLPATPARIAEVRELLKRKARL